MKLPETKETKSSLFDKPATTEQTVDLFGKSVEVKSNGLFGAKANELFNKQAEATGGLFKAKPAEVKKAEGEKPIEPFSAPQPALQPSKPAEAEVKPVTEAEPSS